MTVFPNFALVPKLQLGNQRTGSPKAIGEHPVTTYSGHSDIF